MLLYFIRHGETAWNVMRKIQGVMDISLNENGVRLAKITGDKLRDIPFDFAVSSPLSRATETARLALGGRDIPIYTDDRLREINFGELEGTVIAGVDPAHPFYKFFADAYHFQPARGGESIYDVCARTKSFYDELISRPEIQDATILVALHGCSLRALLHGIYEDTTDFWHGGVCPNCGVNIVEVKDGKSILVAEDVVYY